MRKEYKTHMLTVDGMGENGTFTTLCGIRETCTEDFYDESHLIEHGLLSETSCKKCCESFEAAQIQVKIDYFMGHLYKNKEYQNINNRPNWQSAMKHGFLFALGLVEQRKTRYKSVMALAYQQEGMKLAQSLIVE